MRLVVLCAVAGSIAAGAAPITGATDCGAYRFELEGAEQGSVRGTVCDERISIEGTHRAGVVQASRVRLSGLPKPVDLRQVRLPALDPRSAATVEAFTRPLEALRLAEQLMRELSGGDNPVSGALVDAESLGSGIGGDVGCTDAESSVGAVVDVETSISGNAYYVPPACIVIVEGSVDVVNLRVDGVLIRAFGGIRARTLRTGTVPVGAFGGHVAAFSVARVNAVRQATDAADSVGLGDAMPDPARIEADEVVLRAGGLAADELVANRLEVQGAAVRIHGEVKASQLETGEGGHVHAGALAADVTLARGGGIDVSGEWRSATRGEAGGEVEVSGGAHRAGSLRLGKVLVRGGALAVSGALITPELTGEGGTASAGEARIERVQLTGGARLEVSRILSTPALLANASSVEVGDGEVDQLILEAQASFTARSGLDGRPESGADAGQALVTDSALTAGRLELPWIRGTRSRITARERLRTSLLEGTDTHVEAGEQAIARSGAAKIVLSGGSLSVTGTPVTGTPGFEGCAAHIPQIDVGTLDVRGGPVDATHVRADTLYLRGGHLWPKNADTVAQCLESERTDVDGLATEPFLRAPRLYARVGKARFGENAELVVTPSGGAARTGSRPYPSAGSRPLLSGASFGGFGGTSGDLNTNVFDPAAEPGADTALGETRSPMVFREGGVGGYGKAAGAGGGTIRIRGTQLTFDGTARANGSDGVRGAGGGSGGTLHVELEGALAGKGLFQVNGGAGGYGDPGFFSAGGGSAGRIRIDCTARSGWRGRTETFGGLGASLGEGNDVHSTARVPAWDDWRNHGGPGTVYWRLGAGRDELVIEGPMDGSAHRGVGFLDGAFPDAEVVIRRAVVAVEGLQARGLRLEDRAVVRPNNPRVRLEVPPQHKQFPYKPASVKPGLHTTQIILPSEILEDPVEERLAISVTEDVSIDRSSRIDVSGLGGTYHAKDLYRGSVASRAGGSHGGLGGLGRAGNEDQLGRPEKERGDLLEPTTVGGGGFGNEAFQRGPHAFFTAGGIGGGVLRLTAGGKLRVDGAVRADGAPGAPRTQDYRGQGSGGGAGGSAWVTAKTLEGSGVISAAGGHGTAHPTANLYGGGGGGGRVRVDVQSNRGFRGRVTAEGGAGASLALAEARRLTASEKRTFDAWKDLRNDGGAGTVAWAVGGKPLEVRVENVKGQGGVTPLGEGLSEAALVIRRATVVSAQLRARSLRLQDQARLTGAGGRAWLHPRGQTPRFRAFHGWEPFAPEQLTVEVLGSLEVERTSSIDVDGLGGLPRTDEHCSRGAYMNLAGGSHGGKGGRGQGREPKYLGCPSEPHGEVRSPVTEGQGGYGNEDPPPELFEPCRTGGSGGGVLRVKAASVKLDGRISADGVAGSEAGACKRHEGSGGGAGGSVWLTAGSVTGRGKITAAGGAGTRSEETFPAYGGGGAGGRVRVESPRCQLTGGASASGGDARAPGAPATFHRGGEGTVEGRCRR